MKRERKRKARHRQLPGSVIAGSGCYSLACLTKPCTWVNCWLTCMGRMVNLVERGWYILFKSSYYIVFHWSMYYLSYSIG